MNGEDIFKKLATAGLSEAKKLGATTAEIVLSSGTEDLTRFANNMIHQSVSLTDSLVHVRFIIGKKIGVARTNRLDSEGIRAAVSQAKALALLQKEDENFVSLPSKAVYSSVSSLYKKAKHIGAVGRAKAIGTIIRGAKKEHLVASGAFVESESESAVANTNGVWAYNQSKSASLSTIFMGVKGSGFASHSARGGNDIDVTGVTKTAVYKATYGKELEVAPGEYEVILEAPAVAELLDFFAWLGPNARIYHEDVSFYQGNIGKQLFHSSLTIHDDPYHTLGYPTAFDWEGFPKAKQTLVEKGKLKNVVYDSYHAAKYKAKNTGHALLAPNTFGPVPTHLVVEPGTKTISEMIKGVKKGLLVTRFWYTRVIAQKSLTLTGMTRDGTFYIENGKIVGRVRNLRYTESVVNVLKDVRAIGHDLQLIGTDEGSPTIAPALHLGKFRFTGVTRHR